MKTKLMFIITFFLFILISNSYAQKNSKSNCKYSKNVVDEFTKKLEVRTNSQEIIQEKRLAPNDCSDSFWCRTSIKVAACNLDGVNYLLIMITECNCDDMSFDKISFLLQNDEVLNFYGDSQEKSRDNLADYWQFYAIKDTMWSKLKTNPLKKIRIQYKYSNTQRNFEVKESNINKVMQLINCIDVLAIPKPMYKKEEEK